MTRRGILVAMGGLTAAYMLGRPCLARAEGDEHLGHAIPQSPALGMVTLRCAHTGQTAEITYADHRGRMIGDAVTRLSEIGRDWRTGEIHPLDSDLLYLLDHISAGVGRAGEVIELTSGYRSPTSNRIVGGARRSLHMRGMALDIRIPGVSTRRLRDAAMDLAAGGVGYYRGSGFVHVDTGRVRYWSG